MEKSAEGQPLELEEEPIGPLWEDDEGLEPPRPRSIWATILAVMALIMATAALGLVLMSRDTGRGADREAMTAARIQALEDRIGALEKLRGDVDQLLNQVGELAGAFSKQIANLGEELEAVKEKVASLAVRPTPPPAPSPAAEVRPTPRATPRVAATPKPVRYHVVRRGETLYSISRAYGLEVNELIRINGLDPTAPIYVGQRLQVTPGQSR